MTAQSLPLEIDGGSDIWAVSFTVNGEYLISGGEGVGVWQVKDGKQLTTMEAGGVRSLAASKDGSRIAAGTLSGDVFVWDAKTYERVLALKEDIWGIFGVDFSPDSTRLVAASYNNTATVWNLALGKQVQILRYDGPVRAAKYDSLYGDRLATATRKSIRVWDSNNDRLLVDINVKVTPSYNTGLVWFNNHLLVISDGKIKQIDASTGSAVSEWPVPATNNLSCISLPQKEEFIAYSTKSTVSFWDTLTHTRLGLIRHSQYIISIALSPDDRFLAIGGDDGKITIQSLSPITNSISLSRLHTTFQESDFRIDDATLDSWKQVQLASTDALLTAAIHDPQNPPHPILASRALVRARLQQWDAALVDAETAINIQPSVIGYIAKSIAHVGMGEIHKAYQACDIAFEHFHSSHGTFILLVKAIIVSKAGQHRDAISQVDNLIATVQLNSICYVVQAYMYLLLGNSQMERCEFTAARQSFERALTHIQHHTSQALFVVSLISGWKFDNLDVTIRQRLCEALYAAGRTKDAVEYFYQIPIEFREVTNLHDEHLHWVLDFSQRSSKELEHLGDTALGFQQYDDAISLYTTALSLNPQSPLGILIKRGKAFLATGSWKQALDDANQVITLDPSSPSGYEVKHAASHKAGDYDTAVDAFEVMLSKIAQSPNPDIQRLGDQYNSPSSTRATIRKIVQRTIRHLPRVLINTTTGRLHERAEQASTFEAVPIFNELVSSMTTRIDYVRIKREVRHYFRYVMLSHRWEENEPLFHQVIQIAVYELDTSPTHDKLQTFCKIVRDAGFNWAWSDTCCIDKKDHFVLQEALVAMFKWYRSSAMMIVFLRGVRSSSQRGALAENVWNKRGWTLQEYIASKVIHFYTEDWTLYLNLQLPNHKESPEIISEMEKATGVSAQQLIAVRPGLSSIREKLRLASTRQTTMLEDAAYSLLGIFSVTGLPTIYGAGEGALGRLLALILAGSGDVRILAWTGESGSYNSCLPAHITVFKELATSHLPTPIPDVEMESIITTSQSSSFDLDVALRLYNRLNELPAPWFAESRMKLPCIAFQLPPLSQSLRTRSGRIQVYRADTDAFGMVEIKTRHDLSRMKSLYLVHPWLDTLLEREDKSDVMVEEDDVGRPPSPSTDDEEDTDDDSASLPELDSPSQPAHARMAPMDKETQARRLVAHLGQPFGALLVASASTGGRAVDYKRVAADSIITVRFQTNVSLADILDNVRTLDVL